MLKKSAKKTVSGLEDGQQKERIPGPREYAVYDLWLTGESKSALAKKFKRGRDIIAIWIDRVIAYERSLPGYEAGREHIRNLAPSAMGNLTRDLSEGKVYATKIVLENSKIIARQKDEIDEAFDQDKPIEEVIEIIVGNFAVANTETQRLLLRRVLEEIGIPYHREYCTALLAPKPADTEQGRSGAKRQKAKPKT